MSNQFQTGHLIRLTVGPPAKMPGVRPLYIKVEKGTVDGLIIDGENQLAVLLAKCPLIPVLLPTINETISITGSADAALWFYYKS